MNFKAGKGAAFQKNNLKEVLDKNVCFQIKLSNKFRMSSYDSALRQSPFRASADLVDPTDLKGCHNHTRH